MTAKRVFYSGRVQGVGFRYATKRLAGGFEVVGWVRNLPDGRVEMLAASWEEEEVDAFLGAMLKSDLRGNIQEWEAEEAESEADLRGFSIR